MDERAAAGPDKLISASSLAPITYSTTLGLSPLLDRATGMEFHPDLRVPVAATRSNGGQQLPRTKSPAPLPVRGEK